MKELDIITIAFNNLEILEIQYNFLCKNIKNSFTYNIIDNSSDLNISNKINSFCINYNINYLKTNVKCFDCSQSHAAALNYSIKNLKLLSANILFLDHDIIPVTKININNFIKNNIIYGHQSLRNDRWYMWPGLFLIKNDSSYISKLDFNTISGLDTGGKTGKLYFVI